MPLDSALLDFAFIEAEVTFLPAKDAAFGGRPFPLNGYKYQPHIVIGDPGQRRAVVDDRSTILEKSLGVSFRTGPELLHSGVPAKVTLALMYWPREIYEAVVPEATFTIREGADIVGYGTVSRRWTGKAK
jgi:hypothetical protein